MCVYVCVCVLQIRVRESGAVAVASARESESRAPWEFLNSTCTAAAESKVTGHTHSLCTGHCVHTMYHT